MYNRIQIEPRFFMDHFVEIMKRIEYFQRTGFKQHYHIIVEGLDLDWLGTQMNSYPRFPAETVDIYVKTEVLDDRDFETFQDSRTYFTGYERTSEDKPGDQTLLHMYYSQQVKGFSGIHPETNRIVSFREDGMLVLDGDEVFDFWNQEISSVSWKPNLYLGKKRKCKLCLNCLCDMTKTGILPFFIEDSECEQKWKLKERVSKEVKEVTREEYQTLLEQMSLLMQHMTTDHATLGNLMVSLLSSGKEEE